MISCSWLVSSQLRKFYDLVQVVVLAGLQPRLDRGGGLLGLLGEHVVGPQQLQRLGHDLAPGQLLGGQRPVVRHLDPWRRGVGDVEGELEQPGRREPQRELPPELVHPRLVRPATRRGPGRSLPAEVWRAGTNTRTSSRPGSITGSSPCCSSFGPLHRADQETLPQLVIDYPFDLVKLGPFHGASTPFSPRLTSQRHGSRDGSGRGMSVVSAGMSW